MSDTVMRVILNNCIEVRKIIFMINLLHEASRVEMNIRANKDTELEIHRMMKSIAPAPKS